MGSWLVVAVLASIGGAFGWSSDADACSCLPSTRLDQVHAASIVVRGEPVDERVEDELIVWRFRVDERFMGDTPDLIEISADRGETSCGPPPDLDVSVLALGQRGRFGWHISPGCGTPVLTDEETNRFFGPPPPADGVGPPAAIASAASRDHSLAVVDAAGRPLRYLPSTGLTLGLAPCPGATAFVQVRTVDAVPSWEPRQVEVVRWSLPQLEPVEVTPIPEAHWISSIAMSCRDQAGRSVLMVLDDRLIEVVGGVVSVGEYLSVDGPFEIVPADDRRSAEVVFDAMGDARLAMTWNGAWVEAPNDDVWRVPFVDDRGFDWTLGLVRSVVATPDGGWRVVMLHGDDVVEMSIGDHAWKEGPLRSMRYPVHPEWAAVMFVDESVAGGLDVPGPVVEPASLVEPTGRRVGHVDEVESPASTPPESITTISDDAPRVTDATEAPVADDGRSWWPAVGALIAIGVVAVGIVGAIGRRRGGREHA